ncbi:MAG TPA: hypothetical protein VFS29_08325 [Motilibacteraceae bacterium]|nr:hypothetical protein [Motilibacteraceae bacterium]
MAAAVRALLALVAVAHVLAVLWWTPHPSTYEQFRAAARSGTTSAWAFGEDGGTAAAPLVWQDVARPLPVGSRVLWRDGPLLRSAPVADALGDAPDRYGDAARAAVRADAGALPLLVERSPTRRLLAAGILAQLLALAVVAFGPLPRRRTRWAWAWALLLLPYDVGLLWWLARELPWSRRAAALPAPRADDGRVPGWGSFLTCGLGGFALAGAVQVLGALVAG